MSPGPPDAALCRVTFFAIGVLVDAFIVRMVLVSAIMTLLGKASWWFPARLGPVVPEVDIEGSMVSPAGGEAG